MEYLNQIIKVITKDDRAILGKLKCLDYLGNIYLSHSVEIFSKESDFVSEFEIFENSKDATYSFESDSNVYHITGTVVIRKESVKSVSIKA